mgnify:CR=1 FL=1
MAKNLIQEKITELVKSYIEKGFVISEGYTADSIPSFTLVNRKDQVVITSHVEYETWPISSVKVYSTLNGKVDRSYMFYKFSGLISTSRKDIEKARAINIQRCRNSVNENRIVNLNEIGLKMLRNKKGWKTVPAKNIEVVRLGATYSRPGYLVKNVTNNHQFIKYF